MEEEASSVVSTVALVAARAGLAVLVIAIVAVLVVAGACLRLARGGLYVRDRSVIGDP